MESSSDKKVVGKRKGGNAMSSVLVAAAIAAAGGIGHFLWKYQARLDEQAPAPVPAAAPAEPIAHFDAPAATAAPLTQLAELLPATPPPPPPAPKPVKAVRGDITITGKNGTTSAVAPPTAEDLASIYRTTPAYTNSNTHTTWRDPNAGPRVYVPDDPNRHLPKAPIRSGDPRYYDYDANRFRGSYYEPQFQRRTTIQRNTTE